MWLPIGAPNPSCAPSMTALRSIAAASARRTRTSSKGFFLLLIVMIVLPSVPPATTEKRGSFWNCFRLSSASNRGMPSMSPASSAATCAAASLMKRNVTFFICTLAASRYCSFFTSVTDDPLAHESNLYGPVPIGRVAVAGALFGSTMTAVFSPIRNRKLPSALLRTTITVCGSGVSIRLMLSNTDFFALLVEPGALARSKLNLTSLASNASPSWNFTPFFSLKV